MPYSPEEPTYTNDEFKAAVQKAYLDGFSDSRAWPNHNPEYVHCISPGVKEKYFIRIRISTQTLYR